MKILISGASGLLGTALANALQAEGHRVARLVRPGGTASAGDVRWDPNTATVDSAGMEGSDVIVHLSGAGIAEARWTPPRKQILRSSRIGSTRVLVDSIAQLWQKPRLFVSASAIGYYGNRGDEILTEMSSPAGDFLAVLARDWENEAMRVELSGIRAVILRFGMILSAKGGALPRMLTPFKWGVGGRLGSGEQWISWISLEDAVGALRAAISSKDLKGPVNLVAPNPVQNAEFTRLLAGILRRPAIFPAPAFMLRLMLGELADALLLASQRVRPERLLDAGYRFRHDHLESALRAILPSS